MYSKTNSYRPRIKDSYRDMAMQEEIRNRANYSMALIGMAFVRHGSGRFLNLRSSGEPIYGRRKTIDDRV
jgi:hypothetical protein